MLRHDRLLSAPRTGSIALVAAHPDDEVIGAGGWLMTQWVRDRPVRDRAMRDRRACLIVHVTDGAPRDMHDAHDAGCDSREAYARTRRNELDAALACAGITARQCRSLDLVDREASLDLASLARRLAALFAAERIGLVLTHPYEGGHPDHDATAFAVHAAAELLRRDRGRRRGRSRRRSGGHHALRIREMTSYHAGPHGLRTGTFLPARPPIATVRLACAQRRAKRAMLSCFATQQRVLESFTDLRCERFRRAPRYRFVAPPHPGALWYERFDWGIDGRRWRALATRATAALGLETTWDSGC